MYRKRCGIMIGRSIQTVPQVVIRSMSQFITRSSTQSTVESPAGPICQAIV